MDDETVQIFRDDYTGKWGWQCFLCGASAGADGADWLSMRIAEAGRDAHECEPS